MTPALLAAARARAHLADLGVVLAAQVVSDGARVDDDGSAHVPPHLWRALTAALSEQQSAAAAVTVALEAA